MSIEVLVPDPEVLIMGLRDTGYDSNTALADIVDNSVDANASKIQVRIQLDVMSNKPFVMIADNGCGMNRAELIDGMKYGSSSTKGKLPSRLGKFGLGLKTASTAFCKRFSVISRSETSDQIYMATWDLDKVARDNAWSLEIEEEEKIPSKYKQFLNSMIGNEKHGTLVVWEKVDRFPSSKTALDNIAKKFSNYASLIYHRFLDEKDARARNLSIMVNGKELQANDPFCKSEMRNDDTGTISTGSPIDKECDIQFEDGATLTSTFHLQGYVLPIKTNFSSKEALDRANITNHNMGFYVYRENRMIADGDWLGLKRPEPHDSLYRAEFSFDHTLDAAFKIDVKKSRIELDPELGGWLQKWMAPGVKMAEDRYRRKIDEIVTVDSPDYHADSDRNITEKEANVVSSKIEPIGEIQPDGTQKITVKNCNLEGRPQACVVSIKVASDETPGVVVKLDEGVRGGALWEPSYKDGHQCVLINPKHSFYRKVYYPNLKNGIAMSGLDDLLWSCSCAEFGTINEYQRRDFEDFRMKVSKILERLVEDLPEPDIE